MPTPWCARPCVRCRALLIGETLETGENTLFMRTRVAAILKNLGGSGRPCRRRLTWSTPVMHRNKPEEVIGRPSAAIPGGSGRGDQFQAHARSCRRARRKAGLQVDDAPMRRPRTCARCRWPSRDLRVSCCAWPSRLQTLQLLRGRQAPGVAGHRARRCRYRPLAKPPGIW